MRYILSVLSLLVALAMPALALPMWESSSDQRLANFTNTTAAVPATSTAINLTAPSRHLIIKTDSGAAVVYFRLDGGTATTANFKVDSGAAVALDGLPGITSVTLIGASATGNYSILAW